MKEVEMKKYWIWFSILNQISRKKAQILFSIYNNPKKIYELSKEELLKIKGIGEDSADNIIKSKNEELLKKHMEYIEKNKIEIISILDDKYPRLLKNIYDPPICLYVKGNFNIENTDENIAIIGCRDCSKYGESATKYFSYNLALKNKNIISGLAKGIDSFAHKGCIYGKGKTIAVVRK